MSGCPLDEAFNIDLQNVKIKKKKKDKLKGLAENIEYNGADYFRQKVETIKDSYFPKTKANDETSTVAEDNSIPNLEGSMAAYTAAISNLKNLLLKYKCQNKCQKNKEKLLNK